MSDTWNSEGTPGSLGCVRLDAAALLRVQPTLHLVADTPMG